MTLLTELDIFGGMKKMKNWTPEEIKELRERFKLSQQALSDSLGVSRNYIYLLEKGVKTPSKTLQLLLNCVEKELKKYERR